jgi:hypothetical protein
MPDPRAGVTSTFSLHGYHRRQSPFPQECVMSEENPKTPLDHVADTLSQLKEMRHYSKNNVELLTTQWLMFDGELSKLKQAAKIENLMMRQSEFHDALETVIAELEEVKNELQPAPEAEG